MPLTPNRKVDRKVLAASRAGGQSPQPEAGEQSELEQTIVKIWRELLGVEAIGLRTNFFDLGATSLTVAEAATSLREALRREIKLTDLFAYPTVASLASHLRGDAPIDDATNAATGRGISRRGALAGRASRRRESDRYPPF
jgi:acyl carrier protein